MDERHDDGWIAAVRAQLRRLVDGRREGRRTARDGATATLSLRGRNYPVTLLDLSDSGAMIAFDGHGREGDPVTIQLLDHGLVAGQVRWIRDGRAGIFFHTPLSGEQNEKAGTGE